jgi:hypothetical protein
MDAESHEFKNLLRRARLVDHENRGLVGSQSQQLKTTGERK